MAIGNVRIVHVEPALQVPERLLLLGERRSVAHLHGGWEGVGAALVLEALAGCLQVGDGSGCRYISVARSAAPHAYSP